MMDYGLRESVAKEISELQKLGMAPLGLVGRVMDGEFDYLFDGATSSSLSMIVDMILDVAETVSGGKNN